MTWTEKLKNELKNVVPSKFEVKKINYIPWSFFVPLKTVFLSLGVMLIKSMDPQSTEFRFFSHFLGNNTL